MKQTERPSDSCSGHVNFSVNIFLFKCGSQYATRPRELQHVDTRMTLMNNHSLIIPSHLTPAIFIFRIHLQPQLLIQGTGDIIHLIIRISSSITTVLSILLYAGFFFFFFHCIIFLFNHVSHSSFWFKPKHQQRESFQSTIKEQSWPPAWRRKSENLSLLLWAGRQDAGNLGQHECQMTFTKHKNSAVENWQVWNHKSVSCWRRRTRRRRRKRGWAVCLRRHASDIQFENTHIHSQQKIIAMCNTLQQWQWDVPLLFISRYMTSV